MLAVSVEKIISLYIQKYRFEHYENNQDKYHEKLVLQKKKGGLRASGALLLGTNQQEPRLWGPKPLQVGRVQPQSQSERGCPPQGTVGTRVGLRSQGGRSDQPTA